MSSVQSALREELEKDLETMGGKDGMRDHVRRTVPSRNATGACRPVLGSTDDENLGRNRRLLILRGGGRWWPRSESNRHEVTLGRFESPSRMAYFTEIPMF